MNRRRWLTNVTALAMGVTAVDTTGAGLSVLPGRPIRFPEDEGSHPDFRTEWWYITGWLDEHTVPLGFQVTFFRTRPHPPSGNPSRFDPGEIIIGHAALSEASHGRLRHAQRVARTGFGLAQAATQRMDVRLGDWSLTTPSPDWYAAHVRADDFALSLAFGRTQPPLLQGDEGYSRKGPHATSASHYYSHPHLRVQGRISRGAKQREVAGTAWLDHEWSSQYMDAEAAGWDWIGINLDDGGAVMAFRMRTADGRSHWSGATLRTAQGVRRTYVPQQVRWEPLRRWRSPRTGASYPVAMRVSLGDSAFEVEPLFDDQESDARASTGTVYWEGAVTLRRDGKRVGRGYLELTGYLGRLRL